jgi:hypothetical protein
MAGFTDYFANKLLDHARGVAYTPPAGLYVALFSVAPTDTGGGTEVTTTIRAAGRLAATFGASAGRQIANSAAVDFGLSAGSANVTHFGIFDAASGGNLLGWNPLTTPIAISPNIDVNFPVSSLTVKIPTTP